MGYNPDKDGKETADSRYKRLGLRPNESGPGPEFGFWEVDDDSWTNAEALRRESTASRSNKFAPGEVEHGHDETGSWSRSLHE